MIKQQLIFLLIVISVICLRNEVLAQNKKGLANPPKQRKAILNFEDELVEGSTQKPDLFYLFQKKNFNYKRLIKLRENFLPEMKKTAEDVQRVRGVN